MYRQYSEFRTHSVFQGKRKLLKNPECKKYIQYTENFKANSVFSERASCPKILKDKDIEIKNFRANSVFQGKRKAAQKS